MASLTHCFQKFNVHSLDQEKIREAAKAYRNEGFRAQEANEGAAGDYLKSIEEEQKSILGQVQDELFRRGVIEKPPIKRVLAIKAGDQPPMTGLEEYMTVKGVSIESIPKELLGGVDPKDVKVGYLDTEGNFEEIKQDSAASEPTPRQETDPVRTFVEDKGIDYDALTDKQKERWGREAIIAGGKTRKVKETPGKNVRPDAERYVDRIRNKNKKKYAQEYLKWLQEGERGDSPEAEGIGVMTAQAVRLELNKAVQFPEELRENVKLRNLTMIDGEYYVVPQSIGLPEIGAVVAVGNTLDEAMEKVKGYAEKVEGYFLDVFPDALDGGQEEIKKLNSIGIRI